MSDRRRSGIGLAGPLALVVLLGLGAANYWRNWRAEAEEFRPYRSLAEAELAALEAAHEREIERLEARYAARKADRARPREGGGGLLADRVEDFERVQRSGRRVRALGAEIGESEAALAAVREEQARRDAAREAWRVHWRRLATLP